MPKKARYFLFLFLLGCLSPAVADSGHLRALGIANLLGYLLPVIGLVFLVFLIAALARFGGGNAAASGVLRWSGSILALICGFGVLEFSMYWQVNLAVVGLILVILWLLFRDLQLRKREEDRKL